jgi:hypothetical protein
MPCPSYFLDFITLTLLSEEYKLLSSSLYSLLYSPVTSSFLGPNILLSILLQNTLSQRSSLNMSAQISFPYKTTGRIIVLYLMQLKILHGTKIFSVPNIRFVMQKFSAAVDTDVSQ